MITQQELKEYVNYNEETGIFTAIKNRVKIKSGDILGTKDKEGYLSFRLNGKTYKAHRLAWLYVYGYMPKFIDHINHITNDNRIINLRDVDKSINARNMSISQANTSGRTGVRYNVKNKKWHCRITIDGKDKWLGYYDTLEEASRIRLEAETKYGFHSNHGKIN